MHRQSMRPGVYPRTASDRPTVPSLTGRLSFAGEPVHARRHRRADRSGPGGRVRRLGRCGLGRDDGARDPGRRRRGRRDVRRRPAVRLPGTAATARDRRRPLDRADLAGAGHPPDAHRRTRPARPRRTRARLPLAGSDGRHDRTVGRLGVVEWISLGAIPAAVPHTRPVPILGTEASPGLLRGDVLAGPAGTLRVPSALVSALEIEVSKAGIPALGYFAQVPHYVSGPMRPRRSSCFARSARTWGPRSPRPSWSARPASSGLASTLRPRSTRRPGRTSNGWRRCTTSSGCRPATT